MVKKNFNIKIRKMKISDILQIERLIQRVLSHVDARKAKKDMIDQSKKLCVDGENFVAEIDNKVIGIIGYWRLGHHPKKVVQLDWFAVHENYQNKGIGSKLLLYMISKLKKRNFQMLCCEKSSKDISSKFFYNKHKFIEFGRIRNYWEDGGDLILLVKYL